MGPLPDCDDFSAGRFSPLRSTLGAPKGEGMELSLILSAGAEELRKICPFHVSGEFKYCLLTSAFF